VEALIAKVIPFLMQASYILMVVVVLGTIVAKITPTPKDNKFISRMAKVVLTVVKYLPTFGVNPNTKKLEAAYDKLKDV